MSKQIQVFIRYGIITILLLVLSLNSNCGGSGSGDSVIPNIPTSTEQTPTIVNTPTQLPVVEGYIYAPIEGITTQSNDKKTGIICCDRKITSDGYIPVTNCQVYPDNDTNNHTNTDQNGHFTITGNHQGECNLICNPQTSTNCQNFYPVQQPVTFCHKTDSVVPDEIKVVPINITVPNGHTHQFRVNFKKNNKNITPTNDITVWSVIGDIGTIDQNGFFIATKAGRGQVVATFGNLTSSSNVRVIKGISETGSLKGKVTRNSVPVEKAVVSLTGVSEVGITDSNGDYSVFSLPDGNYDTSLAVDNQTLKRAQVSIIPLQTTTQDFFLEEIPTPTPTSTPIPDTPTPTSTFTPTNGPTQTPTSTVTPGGPTLTPTQTPTTIPTSTITPTPINTATPTPVNTSTPTSTPTNTPTPKWTVDNSPETKIFGVHFVDSLTGWIVGKSGAVRKTNNGGSSWTGQYTGAGGDLKDIYMINTTSGYLCGQNQTIYTTTNGTNWTSQTSPVNKNLNGIWFNNSTEGWIVGENGTILHTTNSGSTWTTQTSPTGENLEKVQFIGSQGWAVGWNRTIIHTTNGGSNWTSQQTGFNPIIYDLYFLDTNTGWCCGSGGKYFKTTNGGTTWNEYPMVVNSTTYSDGLLGIYLTDNQHCWMVGNNGKIFVTANGGTSWSIQTSGTAFNLSDIQMLTNIEGWITGYDSTGFDSGLKIHFK